jgi:hypothetical protein
MTKVRGRLKKRGRGRKLITHAERLVLYRAAHMDDGERKETAWRRPVAVSDLDQSEIDTEDPILPVKSPLTE